MKANKENDKKSNLVKELDRPGNIENPPAIWFGKQTVKVIKPRLCRVGKNGELLKAVKLITNVGEIMFYPKEKVLKLGNIADFESEQDEKNYYLVSDFLMNNPLLISLKDNCKKGPQEIVLTYCESMFKGETSLKMFQNQWDMIYYKGYHKDDTTNLDKMQLAKDKYTETDIE